MEESFKLVFELNEWRSALRGLCVGSEEKLKSPNECAENVRARLRKMGASEAPAAYVVDLVAISGKVLEGLDLLKRPDPCLELPQRMVDELRRCYHGALQVMPQQRVSKVTWNEAMSGEVENE